MDLQTASDIKIPEGYVRTIHDKDGRLLWGRVAYDTKYAGNISQQTYSGKNLFDDSNIGWLNGTSVSVDGTSVKITNTTTGIRFAAFEISNASSLLGKTVTISRTSYHSEGGGNVRLRLMFARVSPSPALPSTDLINITNTTGSGTATIPNSFPSGYDTIVLILYVSAATDPVGVSVVYNEVQLEVGSSPSSYEPYTGGVPAPSPSYPQPISVATGNQTVTISDGGSQSESFAISLGSIELYKVNSSQDYIYKNNGSWYIHKNIGKIASYNGETIPSSYISTTGQLTTGATVYYVLSTPTDTQISSASLTSQLDAVHEWLTRYGYSSTVSGNLPIIIDRVNL